MYVIPAIGFIVLGILGMEIISILSHKFLFHGPLWFIHKSHHNETKGIFELNDLFSVVFALLAALLIYLGLPRFGASFFLGLGVSMYGVLYFVLHDIMTHRRIFKIYPKNSYLKALIRAHSAHHASKEKHNITSFGLLFFSLKYFSPNKP